MPEDISPSRPALRMRLATTETDMTQVRQLRRELYQEYLNLDLASLQHSDDTLDTVGQVFVAEEEGELIASLRVVPFASGHSELAELGAPLHAIDIDAETVEVSRTVARKTRQGISAGRALFAGAAQWALDDTTYTRLVGYTRLGLVPHFQRIGLQPAGPEFTLPARTQEHYRLLVGRIADIVAQQPLASPN